MNAQTTSSRIERVELDQIALRLADAEPQEVMAWALGRFGQRLGICSGLQAEGCVLIDMAWRIDPTVRVFTIDSGRLPNETHDLIDRIRERYGLRLEVFMPEATAVEAMVAEHGNNLFRQSVDLRLLCCQVRKVMPLRRALSRYDAWVTGLRREQSAARADVRKLDLDPDHGDIVKLAPLADWSEAQVWNYVRRNNVPYNALYDRGYRSIGCEPCTRPVAEGEHPRAGRWWWETGAPKECGMHCAIDGGSLERELTDLLDDGYDPSNGAVDGAAPGRENGARDPVDGSRD